MCGICFSKQVSGEEYSSVKCQFLGSAKVHIFRALTNAAMSSSGWDCLWYCGSWMQPRGWFFLASCLFPRRAAMASSTWAEGRMDGDGCLLQRAQQHLHMARAEKTTQSWFLSIEKRLASISQYNVFRLQLLWFV